MAYDKEALSAALRELEAERDARERLVETRRRSVYEQIPRIRTIENILRSTAAAVVRTALESGEDPTVAVERLKTRNLMLQEERAALLLQHGFAEDYLTPRPACPTCGDHGYLGATPCACLQTRYARKLTQQLSTILPIHDQNFEAFRLDYYSTRPDARLGLSPRENMQDNLASCRDYARRFGGGAENLLLYGSAGLGKTFLSTSIAVALSARGFSIAYDTAISILAHFETEKFGGADAQGAARHIRKYKNADLLIIDDLGSELVTAFTISALYSLLNDRLMSHRSMIVNTNLLPADLERRYSPAIASRILGEFSQLRFFGDDIRVLKRHGAL